jgi:hypothetical protein
LIEQNVDNGYTKPDFNIGENAITNSYSEYPYIHLVVKDPSSTTVVDTSSYDFWYLREYGYNYTLPSNAPTGTYTISTSLETGPYQGMVSGNNSFIVGVSANGMHITSPAPGSTITASTFQVSGTFDTAYSSSYKVSLTVSANNITKTYTFPCLGTTNWGPSPSISASDFNLTQGHTYPTTVEGILLDSNDIPVMGIDTGSVSYTWTPGATPTITLTLHLSGNKFNFVSFPFEVNPSQIPNFVQAYTFDWSHYWAVWTPTGRQDFTTFEPGKGYWIKVTQDEDVTLAGTPVSSSVTVSVTPGKFNLLGNPFNTPISLSDLNSKNGNHILKVYTFDWSNYWTVWIPSGHQDFTTLEPGRAYWIQLDSSASNTFTFSLP